MTQVSFMAFLNAMNLLYSDSLNVFSLSFERGIATDWRPVVPAYCEVIMNQTEYKYLAGLQAVLCLPQDVWQEVRTTPRLPGRQPLPERCRSVSYLYIIY